jgi:hypothetical protein
VIGVVFNNRLGLIGKCPIQLTGNVQEKHGKEKHGKTVQQFLCGLDSFARLRTAATFSAWYNQ